MSTCQLDEVGGSWMICASLDPSEVQHRSHFGYSNRYCSVRGRSREYDISPVHYIASIGGSATSSVPVSGRIIP